MTTYVNLRSAVAEALADPDNKVFSDGAIGDLIYAGLAEIGRIAPRRFQEDIDPVENQFEYQPLSTDFPTAQAEVDLTRVEIWDEVIEPHRPVRMVAPASEGYVNYSDTGWTMTDGILELPRWVPVYIGANTDNYSIRVWGYAPYVAPVDDSDVLPLSNEREYALRAYCRVEALKRLNSSRELYTQWQTRAGNTDMSPAGLMNALSQAMEDWRRTSRAITVLREAPG